MHFLGASLTLELTPYPQHFQVCIMPYRIDGYTKYIYPLKLHEYLASGRPVVASRIPSLQGLEDVCLATTREEWSSAIQQALSAFDRFSGASRSQAKRAAESTRLEYPGASNRQERFFKGSELNRPSTRTMLPNER